MSDLESRNPKGETPDHPLTTASYRVFASMALLAGTSGGITTTFNLLRGVTDLIPIMVAYAGIAYCFAAAGCVLVLKRFRQQVVFVSSLVIQAILMWLAIDAGLLLTTPTMFLLMVVPAVTAVAGTHLGGLSAVATITCYGVIYFNNHTDDQITYIASSFIDWRLMLFALSVCVAFLWVGTCMFRYQMLDAARKLEIALDKAETSERAKSDFLANMSHEIRTPMNGVIGMLDVALANDMADHQRNNLEVARRSAGSLIRILTDILDLTKLEQGHIQIKRTQTNPKHLIEDAAALFSSAAEAKCVDLMTKGVRGLPHSVLIDSARVGQILSNLIANAVKFTDHGSITISAQHDGDIFMICIQDTGCGMPAGFLPHVFHRFQQADTGASSRRGGTGLGLAICKDLVELMEGHIGVVSTEGEGTRFEIALPAPACEVETETPPIAESAAEEPAQDVVPLHILMAEDNRVNRTVLGSFLKRLGHSFVEAEDGHEAVEFAREGNFDMIIMDVSMPRMDGIEATREIRSLDIPIAHAPIVMLTAHAEEGYINACIDAGADAVLHKPISRETLAHALFEVQEAMNNGDLRAAVAR